MHSFHLMGAEDDLSSFVMVVVIKYIVLRLNCGSVSPVKSIQWRRIEHPSFPDIPGVDVWNLG